MPPGNLPEGTEHFVADSSSLIDVEGLGRLSRLSQIPGRLHIPGRVVKEVSRLPSKPLAKWLRGRPTYIISFDLPGEGDLYLKLIKEEHLDDGESQAIAIAFHRNWTLVIEEGHGRRVAQALGIKSVSIFDLLPQQGRLV